MSLLIPPRRFDPAIPEMMDRRGIDPGLLRADLRVLESINRLLGGHRIVRRHLPRVVQHGPVSVLDLGTGAADVPIAVARWARANRVKMEITAVDVNPEILRVARENTAPWPEIHVDEADLRSLPYRPASFDIVLCALTLHHFADADAVAILQRIDDIARQGYIINDLRRNQVAIRLSRLLARTIITNPIARFDAPASCERAFTIAELREMAGRAGMIHYTIRRHRFFRMVLVGRK